MKNENENKYYCDECFCLLNESIDHIQEIDPYYKERRDLCKGCYQEAMLDN